VIEAVNDIDELTTGLNRTIWQKLMVVQAMDPDAGAPGPAPGAGACASRVGSGGSQADTVRIRLRPGRLRASARDRCRTSRKTLQRRWIRPREACSDRAKT